MEAQILQNKMVGFSQLSKWFSFSLMDCHTELRQRRGAGEVGAGIPLENEKALATLV